MAGGHFFPPTRFRHSEPRGHERPCVMMMPARPMAHCVVGQLGCTLAALPACFKAMCGLGHAGQGGQRGRRRPMGEIHVDVHDLLPVAIPSPDHHHRFLMAFLTLRGARHHPPFDEIDPQRPLGRQRARRWSSRHPAPARCSTARRVARDARGVGPVRGTPAAPSPGRAAPCGPA